MSVDLHQLEKDLKFLADSMAERYKKTQDAYTAARKKAQALVREAEKTKEQAEEDTSRANRALANIQGLRQSLEKEQA
jgi:hypothetical protein